MAFVPYFPQTQRQSIYAAQRKLGINFRNSTLLSTALTHSSYLNEHPEEQLDCNEKLEFVGDAVLDLAIAEQLCKSYRQSQFRAPILAYLKGPDNDEEVLQEGEMTLIRSKVVSDKTLARVTRDLGIGEHLLMGSGEEKSGGRNRNSNLAATFEAIVGAIFFDKGYNEARDFCTRMLEQEIRQAYDEVTSTPKQPAKTKSANKPNQSKKSQNPNTAGKHPKSALQEISQAKHGKPPSYRITKATGKSNAMTFTAQVRINGKTLGSGTGSSKKAAETAAAEAALVAMT